MISLRQRYGLRNSGGRVGITINRILAIAIHVLEGGRVAIRGTVVHKFNVVVAGIQIKENVVSIGIGYGIVHKRAVC